MKDIIITVGLILLGVFVFTMIMGTGNTSLLGATKTFFQGMVSKMPTTVIPAMTP